MGQADQPYLVLHFVHSPAEEPPEVMVLLDDPENGFHLLWAQTAVVPRAIRF